MNNDVNGNCGRECECNDMKSEPQKKEQVYASRTPYPPVGICERNPRYARMMLDNMAGPNSEMSAISLYIYNSLLIDEEKSLSQTFHKIAVVEMHHLEIFGQIARMMGENPRLWTHRGNGMSYWTPGYNKYPTEICPLLQNALSGEQKAIQKYQEQCRQIKDVHIVECLKRIIMDEEVHVEIYEALCKKYCR